MSCNRPMASCPRPSKWRVTWQACPREAYARSKHQLRAKPIALIEEIVARGTDPMLDSWLTGDAGTASATLLR